MKIILSTLFFLLLLTSCQAAPTQLEATVYPTLTAIAEKFSSTPTPTLTPEPTEDLPMATNPLTGSQVPQANLQRLPVMIKVSNFPRVGRPHSGLSFADIVFDYYIGSGMNRFLAVFYGQDSPKIGPVRSGRLVDAQLVDLYQGMLGYGSADEDTREFLVNKLGTRAISFELAPCPAFCGTDTHSVTGVFASSADISQYAQENEIDAGIVPNLDGMLFDPVIPRDGEPVSQINILFNYYNRAEWKYDQASGAYLRWIEEMDNKDDLNGPFHMVPLVDAVTSDQLAFNNIVILFTHTIEYDATTYDFEIVQNKTGKQAAFFRDGYMFMGQWRVVSEDTPIQFLDANGQPFHLKPGNTWIVITDDNAIFNQKESGAWEMWFLLSPDPS